MGFAERVYDVRVIQGKTEDMVARIRKPHDIMARRLEAEVKNAFNGVLEEMRYSGKNERKNHATITGFNCEYDETTLYSFPLKIRITSMQTLDGPIDPEHYREICPHKWLRPIIGFRNEVDARIKAFMEEYMIRKIIPPNNTCAHDY